MRTVLTPEAEADLAEAFAWYERRGEGLGDHFLEAVGTTLADVEALPESYPMVHPHVRRARLRRFPYALIYQVGGNDIAVIGCFHTARDPRRWQQRIGL